MKFYLLKREDGLYLNSDYHASARHGSWRPREKARLYKSLRGIRSALPFTFTDAVEDRVKMPWLKPMNEPWTPEWHEKRRQRFAAAKAIPLDEYFALIARDGYIVEEVNI